MTSAETQSLVAALATLRQHLTDALTAGDLSRTRREVELALRTLDDATGALSLVKPDPEPIETITEEATPVEVQDPEDE